MNQRNQKDGHFPAAQPQWREMSNSGGWEDTSGLKKRKSLESYTDLWQEGSGLPGNTEDRPPDHTRGRGIPDLCETTLLLFNFYFSCFLSMSTPVQFGPS